MGLTGQHRVVEAWRGAKRTALRRILANVIGLMGAGGMRCSPEIRALRARSFMFPSAKH